MGPAFHRQSGSGAAGMVIAVIPAGHENFPGRHASMPCILYYLLLMKRITGTYDIVRLDCLGMVCPDPLNVLRAALRRSEPGQQVMIISDDPASLREIPSYCAFIGHKLIAMPSRPDDHTFVIEKADK